MTDGYFGFMKCSGLESDLNGEAGIQLITACMPAHANIARMALPCLLLKAIESLQGLWHSLFSALLPPRHFTHTAAEAAPKSRATLRVKQAPILQDGSLLITD